MLSRRKKTAKSNNMQEKRQYQTKWQERAMRNSKEQERLKLKANTQNQHKSSKSILPLKSTPPNTLNANSSP
jgi:hypothetical protein